MPEETYPADRKVLDKLRTLDDRAYESLAVPQIVARVEGAAFLFDIVKGGQRRYWRFVIDEPVFRTCPTAQTHIHTDSGWPPSSTRRTRRCWTGQSGSYYLRPDCYGGASRGLRVGLLRGRRRRHMP